MERRGTFYGQFEHLVVDGATVKLPPSKNGCDILPLAASIFWGKLQGRSFLTVLFLHHVANSEAVGNFLKMTVVLTSIMV